MLDAQLINFDATLNSFYPLVSLAFVPGNNLTIAIQLLKDMQPATIRWVQPSTAVVTLTLTNEDQTTTVLTATNIDPGDRSMWKAVLTQSQTSNIGSNNVIVQVDVLGDGTELYSCLLENALIRTTVSGSCC